MRLTAKILGFVKNKRKRIQDTCGLFLKLSALWVKRRICSTSPVLKSQSGNVLFYILIAVALLAALSFAVSRSGGGKAEIINEERARLAASEIIEYANIVTAAVSQLNLRGVNDSDLCFDHPKWGANDYDHAGCTDNFNKIFDIGGAGITWTELSPQATDSAATPDNLWHIYGDNEINNVGTTTGTATSADLILVADELALPVCQQINGFLGVTGATDTPPTDTDIGETRYIGTFAYTETIGDEASGTAIDGQSAGCFENTTDNKYVFYKVLIPR